MKFLIRAITPVVSMVILRATEVSKKAFGCCIEARCWVGAMLGKGIDGEGNISSGAHGKV
jgi:hypothetical protein